MALKPRAKKFVTEYVANGGLAGEAAIAAGHSEGAARTAAWRYLRQPAVIDAVLNETLRQFAADVPRARKVLHELMTSSSNDMTRLSAAKALLEHGGLTITNRIEHILRDERSDSEIFSRIRALSEELGITIEGEAEKVLLEHTH
jgi:phage terminase small subunit